jgi:hypothetical protein
MDIEEIARELYVATERADAVYLKTEPEFPDWTVHGEGKVIIMTQYGRVEIPFSRTNILQIVSLLDVAVFCGKVVFAWNFKNFVSYVRAYLKRHRDYDCKLFDLKIIEGFLGNRLDPPKNFAEALARAATFSKGSWKRVYNAIHVPLITRVVPSLECEGMVDMNQKLVVYSHYEVDRTPTGRLVCQLPGRGYNPHALGDSASQYKPRGDEERFLYLDYKSMEIRVLQHLSGDEELKKLIDSGEDLYSATWKKLTKIEQVPPDWKATFLAVFFGMGADTMSERNHWPVEVSKEIIRRMRENFASAMKFGDEAQESARRGTIVDSLGRRRDLTDRPHVARNHFVQSAASVVCMEKLILLHDAMPKGTRLAYSVHDGFCFFCDIKELAVAVRELVSILESPSAFYQDLPLRVAGKAGPRLGQMLTLPDEWLRSG